MQFAELLKLAELDAKTIRGGADVADVQVDSRRCKARSLFVAVRGSTHDGHEYIPAALANGAAAVVCEDESRVPPDVPCAVLGATHEAAGKLAQAIRGWPARKLVNIAVTGTNGKTTVTHLIRAVLESCGHCPALLGTIKYDTGTRSVPASTTTPEPIGLAEMAAEMVAAGRTHLVMEVSSHALDQDRTAGLEFRVGVFTNLTGDHLDYHETMERYRRAKQKLFDQLSPDAVAVINRDDPAGEHLAAATRAKVLWYGLNPAAELWAKIDQIDGTGTRFVLIHGQRKVPAFTPLIGRHNVYNCLAAAGACIALGIDPQQVAEAIAQVDRVAGRLERVNVAAPYQVFVDYAHTDDALANVLGSLRPVTRGKLIVVFGCGGDRDRTKRPRMARVAEDMADAVIVTSDNPRSEDPAKIIEEIVAGLRAQGREKVQVEPDRAAAIRAAIDSAQDQDVVLIAGKGHENYQILGSRRIHFDDAEVAAEAMRRREAKA